MSWNGNRPSGPWGPWGSDPNPLNELEQMMRKVQESLRRVPTPGGSNKSTWWMIVCVVLVLWAASGIYRVLPDEEGVVLRFGRFTTSTGPGLHYHLPWPVERVIKPKVTIVNRFDVGLRGGQQNVPLVGSPRLETPRDVPAESLMLTGDENIIDIDFSVFWVIKDAYDFLFNIQNPPATVKAVAESAMREIIGKTMIQRALTQDRQKIEEEVKVLMQKTLDEYGAGVEITQVKMQKVDPPAAVIDAFRDVQAARADQERLRNEAQAYRNRVVPESRGEAARIRKEAEAYREQTIAEAEGQAQRFLAVYAEYKNASGVTRQRMFFETMERVLQGSRKVIIDAPGTGVVPYLPLEALRKGEKKDEQP